VPKRPRRPARTVETTAASPPAPPTVKRPTGLLLPVLVVVLAALGIIYAVSGNFWTKPAPAVPAASPLVLPTEPTEQTVDELRTEVVGVVEELTKIYAQSPGAHKVAATLYQFLKQYEPAARHCQEAIALSPRDPVPYGWLAKIRMKEGRDAEALEILASAVDDGLSTAELQYEYAAALQLSGDLPAAERAAQRGTAMDSRNPELWLLLGQIQLQRGELEAAQTSLDRALAIHPNSSPARTAAASVAERLGNTAAAAEHRQALADLAGNEGPEKATFETTYERSLRNIVATVLSTAATEHLNHGNRGAAEQLCLRAIAIDPALADPYRQLANMYHRSQRLPDAVLVQRRLTAIEPENPTNYANLASLSLQLGNVDEGAAVLDEAMRNLPQYAVFPERRGMMYIQSGEWPEARRCLEQAIRLEPSAQRYQMLAEIEGQLGNEAAAEAARQSAQSLEKGS
jgi:tetratricopeptide (TPR) repeat protein